MFMIWRIAYPWWDWISHSVLRNPVSSDVIIVAYPYLHIIVYCGIFISASFSMDREKENIWPQQIDIDSDYIYYSVHIVILLLSTTSTFGKNI